MKIGFLPLCAVVSLQVLPIGVPAAAQDPYREIVALQDRAKASLPARVDAALDDQAASIAIAKRLNRPRLLAVLYQRFGRTLEDDGQMQQALTAYESGFAALSGDPATKTADDLRSLSRVSKEHTSTRATAPADLYSDRAPDDLAQAEADAALPANLLIAIGNAYLQQPQPAPARNAYERALARPEIASMPRLRAYALANLGEVFRRTGAVDDAERTLTEALNLLRRAAPPLESRRALTLIAGIHRDRGRAAQALAEYEEALTLYQRAQDPRGEARASAGLGFLHLQARRFADAQRAYQKSVDLGEQVRDVETLWHAYWGLGQAQRAGGDLDGAAVSLDRSLQIIQRRQRELATDEGKVTLLDSVQQAFDELLAVHLARASSDPRKYRDALDVAERARAGAMHDLMGSVSRRSLDCTAPDPDRRFPAANAAASTPSPRIDVSQRAPAVESASHVPTNDPRCADPHANAGVDPPALGRLVFHVLDDRTVVFAVTSSGSVRGHVVTVARDSLTHDVEQLRDALGVDAAGRGIRSLAVNAQPAVDYRAQLQRLYADLIAPVADALPAGSPVVVEPHGPLWLVPFAALVASDGTALVDRWPLVYAPSSQILDEIRREPAFKRPADIKALIVGNPTRPVVAADEQLFRGSRLRSTFEPLPGAEQEAKTISALLPASQMKLLLGPAASLASVTASARDFTLLHLASHALASASHPLDSFVMLAPSGGDDGRMTARSVLKLSFAADLVTLSACQTGLGQLSGDGVIGLSRAFLARGARSVLVSQWSVSDAATAELMVQFYRRYLQGSEDKAVALQQAMQQVRRQAGYEHPKYWAPFMLVGSER